MPTYDRLIECLQSLQLRKQMFVYPVDVASVQNFLAGFKAGCHVCGVEIDRELGWEAERARGWQTRSVGPVPQMEAKGLSKEEIMNELIEIEIATLREMAERHA